MAGETSSMILALSFGLVQSFVMSSKWLSKSTNSAWSPELNSWLTTEQVSSHCRSIILMKKHVIKSCTTQHYHQKQSSTFFEIFLRVFVFECPASVFALIHHNRRNTAAWKHLFSINLRQTFFQLRKGLFLVTFVTRWHFP